MELVSSQISQVGELDAVKYENLLLRAQLFPIQVRAQAEATIKQELTKLQNEANQLLEEMRSNLGISKEAKYNIQTRTFV